ncbi:hypothetical protein BH09PSE2_BH09PSE2_16880 [soil metagenome]
MRTLTSLAALAAAVTAIAAGPAAAAKPHTAQAASCTREAAKQHLTGSRKAAYLRTCQKGSGHIPGPTALNSSSKEGQAITRPSGVDRDVRSKQCSDEADRRHLADAQRNAYRQSCLATAGPVSEAQNALHAPKPAHEIKGIGENNYKPGAAPAKSEPKR